MNPWILLAISICLEIVATNLLKVSDGFTKLFTHRWFISAMPFRFILSPLFSERFLWAWFTPFGRALALF